jgi:hypothetical protein
MLIMRKRMRGLYNGFDSYVSKVTTLLNYIPSIQNQIKEVEVSTSHYPKKANLVIVSNRLRKLRESIFFSFFGSLIMYQSHFTLPTVPPPTGSIERFPGRVGECEEASCLSGGSDRGVP